MDTGSLSLREIQLQELALLEEFDRICRRHDLRYRLIGGTLLGAIRHEGFIPWDDDVDVCMPRPDYERFVAGDFSKELPDHVKMVRASDASSAYAFAKLIDTEVRVETIYADQSADRYIWIDILPVDGLPTQRREAVRMFRRVVFWQRVQGLCHARTDAGTSRFRRLFKGCLKPVALLIGSGRCTRRIEAIARRYAFDTAESVAVINGQLHGIDETMSREGFLREETAVFEGRTLPIAGCAHDYLRQLYGNYMELPEASERKRHITRAWKERG